jgi:hypothetical protein
MCGKRIRRKGIENAYNFAFYLNMEENFLLLKVQE